MFRRIIQNVAFASNIEELVYDARLFWPHLEDPEVYRRAYNRGFPDSESEPEDWDDWEENDGMDENDDMGGDGWLNDFATSGSFAEGLHGPGNTPKLNSIEPLLSIYAKIIRTRDEYFCRTHDLP